MAGEIRIGQIKQVKIASGASVEIYAKLGLTLFDVDSGAQTILCVQSYWKSTIVESVGDSIISASHSSSALTLTVQNLTANEITVRYKQFVF